jgi:hypothetical protein
VTDNKFLTFVVVVKKDDIVNYRGRSRYFRTLGKFFLASIGGVGFCFLAAGVIAL